MQRYKLSLCIPLAVLAMCVSSCDRTQGNWTLFYYPRGPSNGSIITPGFNSLEMCRLGASERALLDSQVLGRDGADFECGRNCRVEPGRSIAICKETLR